MSREYYNILDITPSLKKQWTVLVQVLECGHKLKSKAQKDFKKLLFTDTQGTRVSAVIFDYNLPYFKKTFNQYKRYYISNANLLQQRAPFLLDSYDQNWSLTKDTLVEPYPESVPPILPCKFQFTLFNELQKYSDTNNHQNVRGVVIKCFPSQEVIVESQPTTKRDVILVNEEKKLLMLTLWDSFDKKEGMKLEELIDDGPLIFAMRIKVTTKNGLSLSTKPSSAILINPPVIEELQIQQWHYQNKGEINALLQKEAYKDVDMLLPMPKEKEINPIARAIEIMKTGKPTWVKGNITLPNQKRSFTQTSCANCLTPIQAGLHWIIKCPHCKKESNIKLMLRAIIEMDDGTGSFSCTIATPNLNKFIQMEPTSIREAEEQGENVHELLEKAINHVSAVAYVRSYQTTHQQTATTRFSIVTAHKLQEKIPIENEASVSKLSDDLPEVNPISPKQSQKRTDMKSKEIDSSSATTSRASKRMK